MNFLKQLMNIDEEKNSVFVWSFVFSLLIAFYQVIEIGDLSDNLLNLIGFLIAAIAGINVTSSVINKSKSSSSDYDDSQPTI